jgi:hypothetical protein
MQYQSDELDGCVQGQFPAPVEYVYYDHNGEECDGPQAFLRASKSHKWGLTAATGALRGTLLDPRATVPRDREWRKISKEAFEDYLRYLRTGNPLFYHSAVRQQ